MFITEHAIELIPKLSSKLKQKTLARANEIAGIDHNFYSPWLCIYPYRSCDLKSLQKATPKLQSKVLLTDRDFLQSIKEFLIQNRDLSLDHLPGNSEEWEIFVDIEKERPELIDDFQKLVSFVKSGSPFFLKVYDSLVNFIVPMKQNKPQGFSNVHLRGAIFLSYPKEYNILSMALDLVHEIGHQSLFLYQSLDPLILEGRDRPIYSEIRKAERPAIMCFHAAAAIAYMLKFLKDTNNLYYRHHDFQDSLSNALERSVKSLKHNCEFSAIGEKILAEFLSLSIETK